MSPTQRRLETLNRDLIRVRKSIERLLTAFLERLRTNAQTLDVDQRQRIMRLLVKEVIVGKDLITIKHSIPSHSAPSGGNPVSSKPLVQSGSAKSGKSYTLCTWRAQSLVGKYLPE